jgi:hypothetical protein
MIRLRIVFQLLPLLLPNASALAMVAVLIDCNDGLMQVKRGMG